MRNESLNFYSFVLEEANVVPVGVLALGSNTLSVPGLQQETRTKVCLADRRQGTPKESHFEANQGK